MKTAVVLFNLGGPHDLKDVRPFLFNLFFDPYILSLPTFFRWPLAKLLSWWREKKAQEIYRRLGGKSPLFENTLKQKEALQKLLKPEDRVFVAMRYWHPFFEEVLEEIKAWDAQKIIFLPLYPQFSSTTTLSFFSYAKKILKEKIPYRLVCCYPQNESFIEALTDTIECGLAKIKGEEPYVLFSAHGVPVSVIKKGDPYESQIHATVAAVNAVIKERRSNLSYTSVICYQSKVGPLPWLGPSLDEALAQAAQNKKAVIVVPLSFVSEHSETLVELDETYKNKAKILGISHYIRVPTVQDHPAFIQGLKALVEKEKKNFKEESFSCLKKFQLCPCCEKS